MPISETDIMQKVTEIDARCKSNTHRIDELTEGQKALNDLAASVKVFATEQAYMKSDITEIKSDVKELTAKPAKRWESVVEKVILTIVGAAIGYLLVKAGLSA